MTCLVFLKKLSAGLTLSAMILLSASTVSSGQTAVTPSGDGTEASPYQIAELGHLVWMSNNAADSAGKYYQMTADIDASSTATWNDDGTDSSVLEGFKPVGTYTDPDTTSFRGTFDGAGHTIKGLTVNRSALDYVGLFGVVGTGGVVENIGLVGGTVKGNTCGGLIGKNLGTVSNSFAATNVEGVACAGGLIGVNSSGSASIVYTACIVKGNGGIIGGLIGTNDNGTVYTTYAGGQLTGTYSQAGGLIGSGDATSVSSSYWDTQVSGLETSIGGTGKTTAEMKQPATFAWWNFSKVWIIDEGTTYPVLRSFLIPGDADCNGIVNEDDLKILVSNYDKSGMTWFQGDFNGDGTVDIGDVGIMASTYGKGADTVLNFDEDYAKYVDTTEKDDTTDISADDTSGACCSGLGMSLIAGLALMGLLLVKFEK